MKRGVAFGAFDMFHIGHARLLRRARQACDHLTVAVTDEDYIRRFKGRPPVIPLEQRMEVVAACKWVDAVTVQTNEGGKKPILEEHRIDVIFVGDDWTPATFDGEGLGVPVVYLPRTPGVSSSGIREALRAA